MDLVPTPWQTVGPYFHLGLTANSAVGRLVGPEARGERVWLTCRLLDGDGTPVNDGMVELWQADSDGLYQHPEDRQEKAVDPAFRGFGRMATAENGTCTFETIKPGRVPGNQNTLQAPHINVSVFARGVLKRLVTRIYFAGDPGNQEDPVLALVPTERRDTLMAHPDPEHPGGWEFNVHLSGGCETVFFDV